MKKVLRKIKFIVSIKRFLVKFYENFYIKYLSRRNCLDLLLSRSLPVYRKNKSVFKLQDLGLITQARAESFERKEPDTIDWIESFKGKCEVIDVGANVGVYSLFCASKGHNVLALEPQCFNFSLLVKNIFINNFSKQIKAFPISLHYKGTLSYLNLFEGSTCGTANSTFDRKVDAYGKSRDDYVDSHGSVGMTLDKLVEDLQISPHHIKIDVDGN